jgi:antitoxin ChpS
MAIPKPLLELLRLKSGEKVEIDVQGGRLVVAPQKKAAYPLADLLAQCDSQAPLSAQDREWLDAAPVGLEDIS